MHPVPKRSYYPRSPIEIAHRTGPLPSAIRGQNVLIIADEQNLSHCAHDLDFNVDYEGLGALFSRMASTCHRHAVFSVTAGEWQRRAYFVQAGWTPHVRDIQVIKQRNLQMRITDADPYILFIAGHLVSRTPASTIILGSGDGHLVCEIAAAIGTLPKPRRVYTLSLAGSTSYRLKADQNPYIAGNIELGMDCLISRHPSWR